MAKRRESLVVKPAWTPSYTVVGEWDGFTAGDPLRINGTSMDFVFLCVHVKDGEVISVIVRENEKDHRVQRAFYPHQVTKPTKKAKPVVYQPRKVRASRVA